MRWKQENPHNQARAGYFPWTSQESQLLMRLLVYGIRRGWRDSNGSMTKATVEAKILPGHPNQEYLQKTLLKILKTYKSFLKVLQQGETTQLD
ncbi:hypothetical protein Bca52824_036227 [Brassica carinata]|uniref:Uncharacterized protein n=1 Tax=Brassica carinata TaxID=52824 RepID=A0A8X7S6R1_BRACI|nr:hypothetical protein Bca52824_036227 [Brassica carinata]